MEELLNSTRRPPFCLLLIFLSFTDPIEIKFPFVVSNEEYPHNELSDLTMKVVCCENASMKNISNRIKCIIFILMKELVHLDANY